MLITKDQIEKLFKTNKIFNKLSDEDVQFLLDNSVSIDFSKKETIFKQGSFASHIMFVFSGIGKLYIEGDNSRRLIVRILREGDFIGLSEMYGDQYFNFTAVALKETQVLQFKIETFKELINRNSAFTAEILKFYCTNTEYIYKKIFTLGTKQMHGRLADVILDLSSKEYKADNVCSYLTRKDIAEFSGMSTESAIRLLTEFKNDGLIGTEGKSIFINNMSLLERLSRIG